jgi:hypothetical protein
MTRADLALLSHVLYYIPRTQWAVTTARVMEWVVPGGVLLVLLQNPDNACMRMVRHFTGRHFDVRTVRTPSATTSTYCASNARHPEHAATRARSVDYCVENEYRDGIAPHTDR